MIPVIMSKGFGKFIKLASNSMYLSKSVTRLVILLVTVNSIVHFDVSMEIYHGEVFPGNVGHTRLSSLTR